MSLRHRRTTPAWARAVIAVAVTGGVAVSQAGCRDPQSADPPGQRGGRASGEPVAAPKDGTAYFGVQLAWQFDTPSDYAERLGRTPKVYGEYLPFPLEPAGPDRLARLDDQVAQVKALGADFMVTLMPDSGLETVTEAASRGLADRLARYNAAGVRVFVRFGHEMNGSWYAWGQQPAEYVAAYRRVAEAVHAKAPRSAMVWGPNYGGGYPFPGGQYSAQPGTRSFELLDSNRDGQLTTDDDPYGPYYPGDRYVDWVGLTNYHWGNSWPWRENELPEPAQFADQLTGVYSGLLGDQRGLPDFYETYAVEHGKPLAINETSAFFNPDRTGTGPSALEIKQAWWSQIFAADIPDRFPNMKMVIWFEHYKRELEANVDVDWTVTRDPGVRAAFRGDLPSTLVFASPSEPPG